MQNMNPLLQEDNQFPLPGPAKQALGKIIHRFLDELNNDDLLFLYLVISNDLHLHDSVSKWKKHESQIIGHGDPGTSLIRFNVRIFRNRLFERIQIIMTEFIEKFRVAFHHYKDAVKMFANHPNLHLVVARMLTQIEKSIVMNSSDNISPPPQKSSSASQSQEVSTPADTDKSSASVQGGGSQAVGAANNSKRAPRTIMSKNNRPIYTGSNSNNNNNNNSNNNSNNSNNNSNNSNNNSNNQAQEPSPSLKESSPSLGESSPSLKESSPSLGESAPPVKKKTYNGQVCLPCVRLACKYERMRVPSLKEILVEIQENGHEKFEKKYSSSILENGLMDINPMNHQEYKRSLWVRNNALNGLIDTNFPADKWFLLLLPETGIVNPSGIPLSKPQIDEIYLLIENGGVSRNRDAFLLVNEKLLQDFQLPLNVLFQITYECCVLHRCAPSMVSYCRMHNIPLTSTIIEDVFNLQIDREDAIRMNQQAEQDGLDASLKILELDYKNLSLKYKDYLLFLLSEFETCLYSCISVKQQFEAKREELHPNISGFEYAICKSVEGWVGNTCAKLSDCVQFFIDDRELAFTFCAFMTKIYQKACIKVHPDKTRELESAIQILYTNIFRNLTNLLGDIKCFLCTGSYETCTEILISLVELRKFQSLVTSLWCGKNKCNTELALHICDSPPEVSTRATKRAAKRAAALKTTDSTSDSTPAPPPAPAPAPALTFASTAKKSVLISSSDNNSSSTSASSAPVPSAPSAPSTSASLLFDPSASALTTFQENINTLVTAGLDESQLLLLVEAVKHAPKEVDAFTNALIQVTTNPKANKKVGPAVILQTSFAANEMDNTKTFEITKKDVSTTLGIVYSDYKEVVTDLWPELALVHIPSGSAITPYTRLVENGQRSTIYLEDLAIQDEKLDEVVATTEDNDNAILDYHQTILDSKGYRTKMRHELTKYADRIFSYLNEKTYNLNMFVELINLFGYNSEIKKVINNIILESESPTCDINKLRKDFCDCLIICDFDGATFYGKKNEIKMKENEMNRKENLAGSGRRSNRKDACNELHDLPSEMAIVAKFSECDDSMIHFTCRETAIPKKNMLYKRFNYTNKRYSKEEESNHVALKSKGLVEIIVHRPRDLQKSANELCESTPVQQKKEREYVCFDVSSIKTDSTGRLICRNKFTRETVDIVATTARIWDRKKKNHMIVKGKVDWDVDKLHSKIPKDCQISPLIGIVLEGSIVEILTGYEYEFTKIRNHEFERHGVAIPKLPTLWEVTENSKDYETNGKKSKVSHFTERREIENQDEMINCSEMDRIISAEKQSNFDAFVAEYQVLVSRHSDEESFRRQVFLERMINKYSDSKDRCKLDTHLEQGESIIKAFNSIDVKSKRSSVYVFSLDEDEQQKKDEQLKIANINQLAQAFCIGFDLWIEYDNLLPIEISKEHAMRIIRQHEIALRVSLDPMLYNVLVQSVEKYFEDKAKTNTEESDEYVCEIEYVCAGDSGICSDKEEDKEDDEAQNAKSNSKPLTRQQQRKVNSAEKKKMFGITSKKKHIDIQTPKQVSPISQVQNIKTWTFKEVPGQPKPKKVVLQAISEPNEEVALQAISDPVILKAKKPSFESKNERLRAQGVPVNRFAFSHASVALFDDNSDTEFDDNAETEFDDN